MMNRMPQVRFTIVEPWYEKDISKSAFQERGEFQGQAKEYLEKRFINPLLCYELVTKKDY
jgi:hypothetical protein